MKNADVLAENDRQEAIESKVKALVRNWGLSRFSEGMVFQWLLKSLGVDAQDNHDDFQRLRQWLLMQLNHQQRPNGISKWQIGCPEIIPLLQATSEWNFHRFPWVATLEAAFPIIKMELLGLKYQKGFQQYRAPTWASTISAKDGPGSVGHDAGNWNVFYLFLHNMDFESNRRLCPKTVSIIKSIEDQYDHAFFSALAPRTHIKQHHGPTNKKLRCHLPLIVPPNKCRLRVGDEVIHVQEGKCFIFDDSFEHEAWNDDETHSRIVLIIDIWHPDISSKEKKFFSFLRNAQLRQDKKRSQDTQDNFYTIIQEAHQTTVPGDKAVWS